MKHIIETVTPGSIAEELELAPGDCLLRINNKQIKDVLDYRFLIQDEQLLLEVMKPDGEIWELEIEKDEYEDLGLVFTRALMDIPKHCQNKCVFCFIDQMPPDMRDTLYFKDDDPRLSFLTGNYITATNLTLRDVKRVAQYHLSPLHISVHAANPAVRRLMTKNPRAGRLLKALRIFNDAGITMHFQIVLCKGINDGAVLDDTIRKLLRFKPGAASLSVVPAGLTQYREGLHPIQPFTGEESAAVVRQITKWQKKIRARYGTAFVFCADEFYIQAGIPIPPCRRYEGFPQLENGVGMTALFQHDFTRRLMRSDAASAASSDVSSPVNALGIKPPTVRASHIASHAVDVSDASQSADATKTSQTIGIVTGLAAEGLIRALMRTVCEQYPAADIRVYAVKNTFFGPLITVSGLLTGRDIINQIGCRAKNDGVSVLFVPRNAFRAGASVMLDDISLKDLSESLGVPVIIGNANGGRFCKQLLKFL